MNTLHNEILSDIETIKQDDSLFQEKNFNGRLNAIDFIEFHIIDRINGLLENADSFSQLEKWKQSALILKNNLESIDVRIFQQLRADISQGRLRGQALMDLLHEYPDFNLTTETTSDFTGYDNLDIFLNGLLSFEDLPPETRNREPEMVFYQKTPARIILDLIVKAAFKPTDVFFDLGSGLGQATILVNLICCIVSKGVEFEPAFCNYARSCATGLHLNDVEFIHSDARYADYSTGTIFFMYTPFKGQMLQEVLQNLKQEAKNRKIKIFTYGPCTPEVARQKWLINKKEIQDYLKEPGEFHSI